MLEANEQSLISCRETVENSNWILTQLVFVRRVYKHAPKLVMRRDVQDLVHRLTQSMHHEVWWLHGAVTQHPDDAPAMFIPVGGMLTRRFIAVLKRVTFHLEAVRSLCNT